jgi:hypothetical protein
MRCTRQDEPDKGFTVATRMQKGQSSGFEKRKQSNRPDITQNKTQETINDCAKENPETAQADSRPRFFSIDEKFDKNLPL